MTREHWDELGRLAAERGIDNPLALFGWLENRAGLLYCELWQAAGPVATWALLEEAVVRARGRHATKETAR